MYEHYELQAGLPARHDALHLMIFLFQGLWYLCRILSGLKRLVKFCKGTRAFPSAKARAV